MGDTLFSAIAAINIISATIYAMKGDVAKTVLFVGSALAAVIMVVAP